MSFPNLPGVQVDTVDGNLTARRVPRTKSTLIVGTSGIGPAENPFVATDRAKAAKTFGLSGTLVQAMEEVASGGCDNIILFRMGTKPAVLSGVGKNFAAGKAITNVALTTNVATITAVSHGYSVGDTVKLEAVTNNGINGEYVIASVPTVDTFTFALVHANIVAGADTGFAYKLTAAGFSISFTERTADAGTRYQIWYKTGVLYVWLDGNLVSANDVANSVVLDNGDISVVGTVGTSLGLQLGTGLTGTLANAITLTAAAALTGAVTTPPPTLVNATTGLGLTGRQQYVALAKAFELLDIFPVDQVYVPGALLDAPNVAFYVANDITTAANNPVTNPDALNWLRVLTGADGSKTYQWANDVVDSEGNTVVAMASVTPAARIAEGFNEVSFAYLIADFCQKQEATVGACIGFIGTTGPATLNKLADLRAWIGFLPTFDIIVPNKATVNGKGLLGHGYISGCTASKLNPLTFDYTSGYRIAGFYQSTNGQYDGTHTLDKNGNLVDLGAYLHLVADVAIQSNGFSVNYASNLAGLVAGFTANLDEKRNLTNKPINVIQVLKANQTQLDALTSVGVNVLRFQGAGQLPVLLHGQTLASDFSDFKNLLRQRIKGLVVRVIRSEANKFIGESTIDGLQLQGLKTALEGRFLELQKRGYISKFSYNIFTNAVDKRLGHANIDINFAAADELVQLKASVGVSRS